MRAAITWDRHIVEAGNDTAEDIVPRHHSDGTSAELGEGRLPSGACPRVQAPNRGWSTGRARCASRVQVIR